MLPFPKDGPSVGVGQAFTCAKLAGRIDSCVGALVEPLTLQPLGIKAMAHACRSRRTDSRQATPAVSNARTSQLDPEVRLSVDGLKSVGSAG